jgi:hypothetical protein
MAEGRCRGRYRQTATKHRFPHERPVGSAVPRETAPCDQVARGGNPAEERKLDRGAITVLSTRYLENLRNGFVLGKQGRPKKATTKGWRRTQSSPRPASPLARAGSCERSNCRGFICGKVDHVIKLGPCLHCTAPKRTLAYLCPCGQRSPSRTWMRPSSGATLAHCGS